MPYPTTGLEHIWAKSPDKDGEQGLSLVQHTREVLSCLGDLARMRPNLPALCGQPRLWHLLFWAAFLHDWGKAAQGFQKVLRGKSNRWNYRHEVLSLAFLPWIAGDFQDDECTFVAAAIATHHKDFPDLDPYLNPADEDSDPLPEMLDELNQEDVIGLYNWVANEGPGWLSARKADRLGVTFPPLPPREEAIAQLCPQTIRMYLKSVQKQLQAWDEALYATENPAGLAYEFRPGVLLRGLLVQADHLASAGVRNLPEPEFCPDRILNASHLSWDVLYEHQRQTGQNEGHVLLIAPTGSGKTEAALLWAARQKPPRLFYTLPYQVSMNAMYDRLEKVFPGKVGLLHGRSTFALYQRLMDREYSPSEAARTARHLRNLAGLAYYPIRVFSPYQMLKAAFQLKGHEALWSDFAEAAFVFDEVHAYEPRRLAMIVETIGYLAKYYGCRFLVMSATLPEAICEKIRSALGSVSRVSADEATYRQFRRHRLCLVDGDLLDETNLNRILQAVQNGARTLVVTNTVGRAQQVWRWMKDRLPADFPLFLLHSRFCGRDRLAKERLILEKAGLGLRKRRPVLVVATQVVEVSLNLDLDVLFSDPAPLEALLQRFGRVNRLGRQRSPAPVWVFRHVDPVFGRVYHPVEQVKRTLEVLKQAAQSTPGGLVIDESRIKAWLDEVYQGDLLESWNQAFQSTGDEFRNSFLGTLLPFQSNPAIEGEFDRLFDGTEVLPEAFYQEYTKLRKGERLLEADQLLVPLSWGHYHQLAEKGLVRPGDKENPAIAQTPYDSDLGLLLEEEQ